MNYLGIDVHVKTSVWCLLDANGEVLERGKSDTTAPALTALITNLSADSELLAGQEVGKLSYFVHDVLTAAGVKLLSFNAYQLRMIASSRKKTDKRDSYWIAKALQSGMMPHPVYIPTGDVRLLRNLLSQRQSLSVERRRWLARARAHLQAAGHKTRILRSVPKLVEAALAGSDGVEEHLAASLDCCARMEAAVNAELALVDKRLMNLASQNDDIQRLKTIPGVGDIVAITLYAWVGDISRFPRASQLSAYAGLVPSAWQSGDTRRSGGITKEGASQLRSVLVQSGHTLLSRCNTEEAKPLKDIAMRVHTSRARYKIAVVAAARHILRVAYYVLRDGTRYDPKRLRSATTEAGQTAA